MEYPPAAGCSLRVTWFDGHDNHHALPAVQAVRRQVFVEEQGIPPDLELDGHDHSSIHFQAVHDGDIVGVARLRVDGCPGVAKVERVAVVPQYRGQGMGRLIMLALEFVARRSGVEMLVLTSQTYSSEFYASMGFAIDGQDELTIAGLPHVRMQKQLRSMRSAPTVPMDIALALRKVLRYGEVAKICELLDNLELLRLARSGCASYGRAAYSSAKTRVEALCLRLGVDHTAIELREDDQALPTELQWASAILKSLRCFAPPPPTWAS